MQVAHLHQDQARYLTAFSRSMTATLGLPTKQQKNVRSM